MYTNNTITVTITAGYKHKQNGIIIMTMVQKLIIFEYFGSFMMEMDDIILILCYFINDLIVLDWFNYVSYGINGTDTHNSNNSNNSNDRKKRRKF